MTSVPSLVKAGHPVEKLKGRTGSMVLYEPASFA
jgi:hypothetical protein